MTTPSAAPMDVATLNDFFQRNDAFVAHLGIQIIEVSAEHAVAIMPLEDNHRNSMLNAHGGAIFSLADMAFGAAILTKGDVYVSANTSVSFLAAGRKSPLRAEAKKIRCGKTLGVYEVRVTDAEDTLVAVCTITGCNTHKTIADVDAYRASL